MYGQPGYPQPGQYGAPQPGQPGYYPPQQPGQYGAPQPGQPGYYPPQQPGQYGAPQPGQPGYYPPQQASGYPPQGQQFGNVTVTVQPGGYHEGHHGGHHGYGQQHGGQSLVHGQRVHIRFGNGKYLCSRPDGTYDLADNNREWETFTVESQGSTTSLRNYHGKSVCWSDQNRFEVRDNVGGDWERFEFRPVGVNVYQWYVPYRSAYLDTDSYTRTFQEPRNVTITPSSFTPGAPLGQSQPTQQPYGQQPYGQQQPGGYNNNANQGTFEQTFRPQGLVAFRANHGYFCHHPDGRIDVAQQIGDWERFEFIQVGHNTFNIRNHHRKYLCWTDSGRMEIRDQPGAWERFEVRHVGHGRYLLYSVEFRQFVHFANTSFYASGNPNTNDAYYLEPVEVRPGTYFIRNHHGRFMQFSQFGITQSKDMGYDERIVLQDLPGANIFAIRSAANNRVMCFDSSHRVEVRDNVGPWETFEVKPTGRPGKVSIYCPAQRKFLSAQANGDRHTLADVAQDWEQYELIPTQ